MLEKQRVVGKLAHGGRELARGKDGTWRLKDWIVGAEACSEKQRIVGKLCMVGERWIV